MILVIDPGVELRFGVIETEERQGDGSLLVKFKAAGSLEMAWYLYQWGDKVDVIEPESLKQIIAAHRRNDFPALP